MASKQITIEGIGLVNLYKRAGNRTMRLSIRPDGEVRISMPTWLPYMAGETFARSRIDWITQNRIEPAGLLRHGDRIGKAHRLSLEPHATDKVTSRIDGSEIRISYPLESSASGKEVQKAAQKASIRALRLEAGKLLPMRLKTLAEKHGFAYKSVGVKQLKSRWGSCSSQQDITLNLFLMQLPWHLIDYVLLHELVHTKHMEHGSNFWREFEQHAINPKGLRKEIAAYQPILIPTER